MLCISNLSTATWLHGVGLSLAEADDSTEGIKDFPRNTKDLYMIYVLNVNVYTHSMSPYTFADDSGCRKLKNH